MDHYPTAISLFRQLEFNGITPSIGYEPNAITFDHLYERYESERVEFKKKIWVNTDVVMYSTLIDSLCRDKLVNDAYEVYPEMIAKAIFFLPNVYSFSILVDALCKDGRGKAVSVLATMMKKGVQPNVVTYDALMDGYFLVNQVMNQGH
ncbi:pentatricopeptide (PPR) repeat protein [Medicago truncatula]|uniref:Pentatricopeptide (PPR) repeat protein n=1 Tax=Medicago truncatula TaxID=3880 RepID=G7IWR5_MEDTR|nr:pentatricopeptide (PPR) repeat protein [Medicago truncatula]